MANEVPPAANFSGLTRTVIAYSHAYVNLSDKAKAGPLSDADWAEIEALVDVAGFEREGVFTGALMEKWGWADYRRVVAQHIAAADWEGTLRHVTEVPGRVILELEERVTHGGHKTVANTVTIYEFNDAGKIRHLDVYVMPKQV